MSGFSSARKGAVLAISGSLFWGIMGVVCQFLLQERQLPALWLVHVRMLFAGLLMLVGDYFINRKNLYEVWHGRYNIVQMLIFSFVTIMAVQFTYLSAVKHMNAAMATVFVSLAPIMTMLWLCLRRWESPRFNEALCCISAVLGAIIMATHGDMTSLSISEEGLLWGVTLPFAGVVYTVQPGYLMKHFRPINVIGWGLLLGGVALIPWVQFWNCPVSLDITAILMLGYTVVFGTAIAFGTFLASLRYIQPHIAAIYELLEPFSAIALSIILLDVLFQLPEWIGTALIMLPVIYLALKKN